MLKTDYEEQWMIASSEDRETAPLRIVPRNLFLFRVDHAKQVRRR
jgi:hypothetical protein